MDLCLHRLCPSFLINEIGFQLYIYSWTTSANTRKRTNLEIFLAETLRVDDGAILYLPSGEREFHPSVSILWNET